MQEKMKMEAQQQQLSCTLTNKTLYADIKENQQQDDDEQLAGYNCPNCGYPVVIEMGLEVCYKCGWSKDDEPEGYYEG